MRGRGGGKQSGKFLRWQRQSGEPGTRDCSSLRMNGSLESAMCPSRRRWRLRAWRARGAVIVLLTRLKSGESIASGRKTPNNNTRTKGSGDGIEETERKLATQAVAFRQCSQVLSSSRRCQFIVTVLRGWKNRILRAAVGFAGCAIRRTSLDSEGGGRGGGWPLVPSAKTQNCFS